MYCACYRVYGYADASATTVTAEAKRKAPLERQRAGVGPELFDWEGSG